VVVELVPGEHGHHFVLELLMGAGHRIAAFTPQAVRLEDAFLKLTKGVLQ
jgi:ABC-2 type transport system ATP-binding protein